MAWELPLLWSRNSESWQQNPAVHCKIQRWNGAGTEGERCQGECTLLRLAAGLRAEGTCQPLSSGFMLFLAQGCGNEVWMQILASSWEVFAVSTVWQGREGPRFRIFVSTVSLSWVLGVTGKQVWEGSIPEACGWCRQSPERCMTGVSAGSTGGRLGWFWNRYV